MKCMPAILVAATIAVVVASAGSVAAADPCEEAARLAAFDLAAARAEYVDLLESDDPPDCARLALPSLGSKQREVVALLAEAEDEIALGREADALVRISKAAVLDPASKRAQELLAKLLASTSPSTSVPEAFAGAIGLFDAGYEDEARVEARKVAAEKKIGIPAKLAAPGEAPTAWIGDRTKDAGTWASGLAVGLVLLVGAVAGVLKPWRWLMRRRFVALGTFTRFPQPPKDAKPADAKPADAKSPEPILSDELKAEVAAELAGASAGSTTFVVVDPTAVEMPELLEVPEQLKPLGKLFQVLFRRGVLTISATAKVGDDGWRITAQISKRRGVVAQHTIDVPLEAGTDVRTAGVFTAAWAMCSVRNMIGWGWERRRRGTFPFNTNDWESLAWLRLALIRKSEERGALHQALYSDHRNAFALARLGRSQASAFGDDREYHAGLNHLSLGKGCLKSRPTHRLRRLFGQPHRRGVQWEPLWFQIVYMEVVTRLHRYYTMKAESVRTEGSVLSTTDLDDAVTFALELSTAIAETWLSVNGFWRQFAITKSRRKELQKTLEGDDEYYLGVLAGALVEARGSLPAPAPSGGLEGRKLWKWLAKFDPDRDLARLVAIVTEPSSHLHASTLYNIGCFWTVAGKFEEALRYLRDGFDHLVGSDFARMLKSMQNDPTFDPLRNDDRYGPEFGLLCDELEAQVKPETPGTGKAPTDVWVVEVLSK